MKEKSGTAGSVIQLILLWGVVAGIGTYFCVKYFTVWYCEILPLPMLIAVFIALRNKMSLALSNLQIGLAVSFSVTLLFWTYLFVRWFFPMKNIPPNLPKTMAQMGVALLLGFVIGVGFSFLIKLLKEKN